MELKILNKEAKEIGKIALPVQFKEPVRSDLVKRAVLAIQANNRQSYGASEEAGLRAVVYVSKRRRAYKTTYGIGQSRTPRKIVSRSGTRMNWVGAFAPQTVGGRRAHPPKASKIWSQKINVLENRKAIRSALSASVDAQLVKLKGHRVPDNYPFVLSDDYASISKTSDLKKCLNALGLSAELDRANTKNIRAGKGKTRGRKYRSRKSVLFVVSEPCMLSRSAANLLGCEVTLVNNLNAHILAPGAVPGRITLFTESALKKLGDDLLFTNSVNVSVKKVKNATSKSSGAVKKTARSAKKVVKSTKKASAKKVTKKATSKNAANEGLEKND